MVNLLSEVEDALADLGEDIHELYTNVSNAKQVGCYIEGFATSVKYFDPLYTRLATTSSCLALATC